MKITIIGRGNAGCISALHFYHHGKFLNNKIEIELIHDSKINPVPVGQATTLDIPRFLWESTDYKNLMKFNFTEKRGVLYENWGNKNKKWHHEFMLGQYAIHFDPKTFQDYVVSNLKINFIEKDENIIDYKEIDSDYIIDCRGAPDKMDKYNPLVNPLNCALLSSLPKDDNLLWTRTIATPDGWCFYIPLKDKVSVGYVFNKDMTSEKKAKVNFVDLLGIKEVNNVFNFKQYVAKKAVIDNRVFLNGNRLFFLEPLEATAMNTYHIWCRYIWDSIIDKTSTIEESEKKIKDYIFKIQNFILWHYGSGSIYKTKFWSYAKKLYEKNKNSDFELIIKQVDSHTMNYLKNNPLLFTYAQWSGWNIKNWIEGTK